MRTAVISDIHANRIALEAVLADAERIGVDSIVCLGDVVGYGPEPVACIELVRSRCAWTLAGNHDDAVSGRREHSDFVDEAADAVVRHRAALSREDRSWLGDLPYAKEGENWIAAHGSPVSPEEFGYVDDETSAKAAFDACPVQLIFVGHTHEPGLFVTGRSGRVYRLPPTDFSLEPHKRYLVNAGSVGYPREAGGVCRSSYVVYDSDENALVFRFLPFSISSVLARGSGKRLSLAMRLVLGALLLVAAVATGLAVVLNAPMESDVQDEQVLDVRRLNGLTDSSKVRLVVRFENGPVRLRETFFAADGTLLRHETKMIKVAYNHALSMPKGAVSVEYALLRGEGGSEPKVVDFRVDPVKDNGR